ncbi:hypothetical protein [Brachybacterium muris]|uniref:hypothetical protein n=1 Tax=Brachybacterium muris TaxID=219301 RepID=UPI00223B2EF6|nr:hypothetical protein [Brachybacterium muris]MCT1653840.1 hypothetical protein [Brachybacterium muris]
MIPVYVKHTLNSIRTGPREVFPAAARAVPASNVLVYSRGLLAVPLTVAAVPAFVQASVVPARRHCSCATTDCEDEVTGGAPALTANVPLLAANGSGCVTDGPPHPAVNSTGTDALVEADETRTRTRCVPSVNEIAGRDTVRGPGATGISVSTVAPSTMYRTVTGELFDNA